MSISTSQIETIVYKKIGELELKLDIISPVPAPKEPNPILIHYHGGFLVLGDRNTFEPRWLINASLSRGWTFVTPDYRLLPEAKASEIIDDGIDIYEWVYKNLGQRIIVTGSSAGGYLALTVSAIVQQPPLSTMLIYGLLDLTESRYLIAGRTVFGGPPIDTAPVITEINKAEKEGPVISGYPFPSNPETDPRIAFIAAMYQDALFPDYLTRNPGLAKRIAESGLSAIPREHQKLFTSSFGLSSKFPPTIIIHGDGDIIVLPNQSTIIEARLKELGVETHLEIVPGAGHGFDIPDGDINVEKFTSSEEKPYFEYLRRALVSLDAFTSGKF